MTITHAEMVRKLAKDGKNILATLSPNKVHIWHMASCIMGEASELMLGFNDYVTSDPTPSIDNIIEECGDVEFYVEGLRDGFNIKRQMALDYLASVYDTLPISVTPFDSLDGVIIAAADIFDACKKWIIYEKDVDHQKLHKALAKYEFHMGAFRKETEISYEQIIVANMAKLAKRYGADYSYTNKAAQERVDKHPIASGVEIFIPRKVIGQS